MNDKSLVLCSRCVLPSNFPNITFNDEGVCNFCLKSETLDRTKFEETQKKQFDDVLKSVKGKFQYDALCCYSGGKDSTYMLKMMVEDFGLNVLAFTMDNGFITEQSKKNILTIVDRLGVDHLFFKPATQFMKKMYREAMLGDLNKGRGGYQTRISDACLSCISLINTHAAKLALQLKIPMVFAGFTPGQIPKAVIKNNYKFYKETYVSQKDHLVNTLGKEAEKFFSLPDSEFEIYQMSPFLVYEKSEETILEAIRQLGWLYPENLDGCSSNCSLNAVGNLCHQKKFGFHPYALELSQLIRSGLMTRPEAIKKLETGVPDAQLKLVLTQLGISSKEIQTRFSGS